MKIYRQLLTNWKKNLIHKINLSGGDCLKVAVTTILKPINNNKQQDNENNK